MPHIDLLPITKNPGCILNLPGSKSIANRVLPLAAISHGVSIIHNIPNDSEDVALMLQALTTLGIKIEELPECSKQGFKSYRIYGCNGQFKIKAAELFCGNSGTSIRFLTAILSVMTGDYKLDGVARMRERPIGDLVSALKQIGANLDYLDNNGYPPLEIKSFKDNQCDTLLISGNTSSQYLTGVLLASTILPRELTIKVTGELISKPYVDITINLIKKFGIQIVKQNESEYYKSSLQQLLATEYTVEPDASSASYFLALGAIRGEITVNNLSSGSLQGDKNFAKVLALMGASVSYQDNCITVKSRGKLNAIQINMEDMPDVAMTIAVLALFANGTTVIEGIHSWRVKETDRLLAMYNELSKLGANVQITDSSITITSPDTLKANIAIDTYNDHRMAMCFSLIAAHGVPVTIRDYECVSKTFPTYFEVFKNICY